MLCLMGAAPSVAFEVRKNCVAKTFETGEECSAIVGLGEVRNELLKGGIRRDHEGGYRNAQLSALPRQVVTFPVMYGSSPQLFL